MEACTENNTIRGILKSEGVFTIHFLLNSQLVIHNNLFFSVTWLHPSTMQSMLHSHLCRKTDSAEYDGRL